MVTEWCPGSEEYRIKLKVKMEQWRESSRSDLLYFICLPVLFLFFIWCKTCWWCAYFLTCDEASSLAFSCVWEGMVVEISTNVTTMVWAAECYFQDLEMICFAFLVFWAQGGFPIHVHNSTLIWPFSWMVKVAVHTKTIAPYCGVCPLLCPLSQGILPFQPVSRPVVDSCLLSLLSHFLESTGDIFMWTTGPAPPSGISQQRRSTTTWRAAKVLRRQAKRIQKHLLMV